MKIIKSSANTSWHAYWRSMGVPDSPLMRRPKVTKLRVVLLALFALVLWGGNWFFTPPLRVTVADGVATIDVQNLGEYNSSLSEIVIRDAESNQIVWRAVPQPPEDVIALWTFEIRPGKNPRRFNIGDGTKPVDLSIVIPPGASGASFFAGHRYEVTISGEPWFGRYGAFHASTAFLL